MAAGGNNRARRCRLEAGRPAMAWLQSLFSPLKKLWIRMHSAHKKSTCPQPGPSVSPLSSSPLPSFLYVLVPRVSISLFQVSDSFICVRWLVNREGHLHPVRGRQVVPLRGRADPLVHPRRVPPPPPPVAAAPQALTIDDDSSRGLRPPIRPVEHGAATYRRRRRRRREHRQATGPVRPTPRECRCT